MNPWQNALDVLVITVPVFAMIGLAVLLRRWGLLTEPARSFLSRFVYLLSLPILIFLNVAGQDFAQLLNVGLIASTLAVTFVGLGVFWLIGRPLGPSRRGVVAVSPWWGNVAYLGFPLSQSAFGQAGLGYAGIVNAFTMPVFILLGVWMLTVGRGGKQSWSQLARQAVLNPIVIAAGGGVVTSLLLTWIPVVAWVRSTPVSSAIGDIVLRTAEMIGQMGLPLALLSIGASLRLSAVHGSWRWLTVGTVGKLVFGPLATLVICRLVFPGMDPRAVGTAVILMGCPLAASSVVIAERLGSEGEFLAALLVVSTAAACVTMPAWLYVLTL